MRIICAVLLLVVSAIAENPTVTYKALVERAKSGDQTVDFRQMREAYFDSDSEFDATELRKQMFQELNTKQFEKALKTADAIVKGAYVDIEGHLGAMVSNRELGNKEAALQHEQVIRGLLQSITGGLDGHSVKTAWVVMEVHEEYAVLRLLGYMPGKQSTAREGGHEFDVMTVTDRKTGQEVTLYFNTDKHWAALRKAFEPEKK